MPCWQGSAAFQPHLWAFFRSILIEQCFNLLDWGYWAMMQPSPEIFLWCLAPFTYLPPLVCTNIICDLVYCWVDPRIDFETLMSFWHRYTQQPCRLALVILSLLAIIGLLAPVIANENPIVAYHKGHFIFPIVWNTSEADLGGHPHEKPRTLFRVLHYKPCQCSWLDDTRAYPIAGIPSATVKEPTCPSF